MSGLHEVMRENRLLIIQTGTEGVIVISHNIGVRRWSWRGGRRRWWRGRIRGQSNRNLPAAGPVQASTGHPEARIGREICNSLRAAGPESAHPLIVRAGCRAPAATIGVV